MQQAVVVERKGWASRHFSWDSVPPKADGRFFFRASEANQRPSWGDGRCPLMPTSLRIDFHHHLNLHAAPVELLHP